MRYIALAHLKDGKHFTEVSNALRVTRHAVMRWLKWFACGGMDRLEGKPHYFSTERLWWSSNFGHINRFWCCHFPFVDGGWQVAQN
jgi:hypothetical protein